MGASHAVEVEEIEEESEAEEAEEDEEEKKGKKNAGAAKAQAAPAVVPALKPFVARPRPEDRSRTQTASLPGLCVVQVECLSRTRVRAVRYARARHVCTHSGQFALSSAAERLRVLRALGTVPKCAPAEHSARRGGLPCTRGSRTGAS